MNMSVALLGNSECRRENVERLARFLGVDPSAPLERIAKACNVCHVCRGPRSEGYAFRCRRCTPSRGGWA
jgi:hypothetical protein